MNDYASVKLDKKLTPHDKCRDVWFVRRTQRTTEGVILMDNTQNQNNTKLEIPPEVRSFLEGLLNDANMTTLDENMREEMINELFARLDSYMTSVIVDKMPPENIEEFIKMNEEKKSRAEIEAFLKEKMPNAQEVLTRAFMDFREMYLSNVSVARNAPPVEESKNEPADAESSGGQGGGNN